MDLERARNAIHSERLDGWLFINFHHRDPLSDQILGRDPTKHNSRMWVYALPVSGTPIKIVHGIERDALDGIPGETLVYTSRDAFIAALSGLPGRRWGANFSKTVSVISFLDHGTAMTLAEAGLELFPADALIQRFLGVLDEEGIASHERAGKQLYDIVEKVWGRIKALYREKKHPSEKTVQGWILDEFERRGMETDHPPIVACAANAGNPHYEPGESSRTFAPGDVVQLDLWAKFRESDAIYADISWVGVYGETVAPEVQKAFDALVRARDTAVVMATSLLDSGKAVSGSDIDGAVRRVLIDAGYESAIRHRTGHGIDVECHGSGANIDSVEFPDTRSLVEGSCFSVEPGLYFDGFGLRTEIDVYLHENKAIVSGGAPQTKILLCK